MIYNEMIYNMEETRENESAEQRENAVEKDMPAQDTELYVGMEDVFEANENAGEAEETASEYEETGKDDPASMTDITEDVEQNEQRSLDASSSNELKNLQRKLDVAQQNLKHARKRLKVLLSNEHSRRNLIRDREYQIKVYEKQIKQLKKEIKKEMARLEKLEDEQADQ